MLHLGGAGGRKQGSVGSLRGLAPCPLFFNTSLWRTHQLWGEQLNRNRVPSSLPLFTPRLWAT